MSLDKFVGAIRDFLAALGILTAAAVVALYQAGFFDWAAVEMPEIFGWLA